MLDCVTGVVLKCAHQRNKGCFRTPAMRKGREMNSVRKCAIAGIAALAAGAGAYLTMPAGRALTEQEKRETWGNGQDCTMCAPEGTGGSNCNERNEPKKNDPCSTPKRKDYACDGKKGTGMTGSTDNSKKAVLEERVCTVFYYECKKIGKNRPKWEDDDNPNLSLTTPCSKYTFCSTVDNRNPEPCNKPKPPKE